MRSFASAYDAGIPSAKPSSTVAVATSTLFSVTRKKPGAPSTSTKCWPVGGEGSSGGSWPSCPAGFNAVTTCQANGPSTKLSIRPSSRIVTSQRIANS